VTKARTGGSPFFYSSDHGVVERPSPASVVMSILIEDLISVPEAATQLEVTKMTLYRWIKKGKIGSKEPGGYICIPKSEVDRIKKERASAKQSETLTDTGGEQCSHQSSF